MGKGCDLAQLLTRNAAYSAKIKSTDPNSTGQASSESKAIADRWAEFGWKEEGDKGGRKE